MSGLKLVACFHAPVKNSFILKLYPSAPSSLLRFSSLHDLSCRVSLLPVVCCLPETSWLLQTMLLLPGIRTELCDIFGNQRLRLSLVLELA